MYGVPPRGHFQGQTRDNSNTRIFTLKRNIYTCVLMQYLSYIHVISYLVWRSLLCFIIFHTHMKCTRRWKFIKNKKTRKMKHAYNKENSHSKFTVSVVYLVSIVKKVQAVHIWPSTVRLLTHVLCKPTHFFFHSFIATMSYPLQTSFNSLMEDWADKYYVWGTPTRSPSRSNSR